MVEAKLKAINIRKTYPGTIALNDVSISFQAGSVHALLGKNGAGKSTLIKILSGATQPTAGSVEVDGRKVVLNSPQAASQNGIATVYQELSLIPELSVAENILFGRLPHIKGMFGLGRFTIDWSAVFKQAHKILQELGVAIDVKQHVGCLGVAHQQLVEIAKAMSFHPKVLLFDEPTSALAHHESQTLFHLIRKLARRGAAVIYISHRLQELRQIVDVVSVLRDGNLIGTISMAEATPQKITHMIFGQWSLQQRPADIAVSKQTVMRVTGLSRRNHFQDVNFSLRRGDVLGVAGMVGSGRTSLLMSIFGAAPIDEGQIELAGKVIARPSPVVMKRAGLGLTPEDRKEQSLVQSLSTRDNICLAGLSRIALAGLIWHKRQRPIVEKTIHDLRIVVADVGSPVSLLSGGNQQKIVVGSWLNTQPLVMLLDEPSRGVDAQSRQHIFQMIWELSRQGISSIFVSSELEELVEVCNRILVMRAGSIVAEVNPYQLQLGDLLSLCMEQ